MPLHPTAVSFLKEIAEADAPAWSEMPPAQGREIFSGFTELFGEGPEVQAVENLCTEDGVSMRLYRPQAQSPLPAVVFYHGGGWVLGDLETHDPLCRRLACSSNRIVLSVDYRLAPENRYPAAADDCYSALLYVGRHANTLGIDVNQVAVAGDSAGGNLAAAVAMRARDEQLSPNVQCQVLIYPVIEPDFETESYKAYGADHMLTKDTMQWFWQQYLGSLDDVTVSSAQYGALLHQDLSNLPPSLVMTAEYDVLRSEGEAFAEQLQRAGNNTQLRQYDGMLHGFVHFSGLFELGVQAIDDMAAYLQAQCKP